MLSPASTQSWRQRMVHILSVVLAISFLLAGGLKVLRVEPLVREYAAWGMPPWATVLAGLAELAGAVMLLIEKTAALAVTLLTLVLLGFLASRLLQGEWLETTLPLTGLLLLVPVGCHKGAAIHWYLGVCGKDRGPGSDEQDFS